MSDFKPILYAEDSPYDVELTLEALSEINLANRVVHVKDGVEAMDYLQYKGIYETRTHETPAVVILDIKMPRMDGIEVLREIRQDSKLKTIPVVMLTSSREEKDLVQSYDLGTNAYIVKPVNFGDFVTAVRALGSFWGVINEIPEEGTVRDE